MGSVCRFAGNERCEEQEKVSMTKDSAASIRLEGFARGRLGIRDSLLFRLPIGGEMLYSIILVTWFLAERREVFSLSTPIWSENHVCFHQSHGLTLFLVSFGNCLFQIVDRLLNSHRTPSAGVSIRRVKPERRNLIKLYGAESVDRSVEICEI